MKRKFEIKEQIGEGTFGRIFKATTINSANEESEIVAIKRVKKKDFSIGREWKVLSKLDHPNCIKLLDAFFTKNNEIIYQNLIFPLYSIDLDVLIKTKLSKMTFFQAKDLMFQICKAINYIHTGIHQIGGIVHRDIKPSNFCCSKRIFDSRYELVLVDYGSCKLLSELENDENSPLVVSERYRSPEIFLGTLKYGCEVDIFSMGCIFAEILTGKSIFEKSKGENCLEKILNLLGTPPDSFKEKFEIPNWPQKRKKGVDWISFVSSNSILELEENEKVKISEIISKCVCYFEDGRWNSQQILSHSFFKDIN